MYKYITPYQVAIPFFAFPKRLSRREKSPPAKVALNLDQPKKSITCCGGSNDDELNSYDPTMTTTVASNVKVEKSVQVVGVFEAPPMTESERAKSEYGRSAKDIPACMWRLLTNPVFMVTCLGSCMELSIVNGFLVFLPKYLETQVSVIMQIKDYSSAPFRASLRFRLLEQLR